MSGPALVDLLLGAAWLLLVGDLVRSAARAQVPAARRLVGLLLLLTMLRTPPRWPQAACRKNAGRT